MCFIYCLQTGWWVALFLLAPASGHNQVELNTILFLFQVIKTLLHEIAHKFGQLVLKNHQVLSSFCVCTHISVLPYVFLQCSPILRLMQGVRSVVY